MEIGALHSFLAPGLDRVETLIGESLGSDIALLDSLNRKLRERPGKMLRPMLALLVAGAAGGVTESTYSYAAATELLHNATLLHDDVVDGAGERRGAPTLSSLLGPGKAVLVGDYWLVRCMQVVLGAQARPDHVLRLYSRTLAHLAEGELLQLEKSALADTTEADYLRIIYGKTASLFEATALAAAISAGADDTVTEVMGRFARLVGTAFQIKDDIFDYSDPADAPGKPVGTDLKEQKITQPLLSALETVSPEEAASVRSAVASIAARPELAAEVRRFVLSHDGPARASAVMEGYIREALSCLDILPESEEKRHLALLAGYIGSRTR